MNKVQLVAAIENAVHNLMEDQGLEELESVEVEFDNGEITEIIVNDDYGIDIDLETELTEYEVNNICKEVVNNS